MILNDGEQVLLEVRKHWFLLFARTWFLPLLAVLPMVGFLVIALSDIKFPFEVTMDRVWLTVFLYAIWLLILWHVAFIFWTDYYLDAWFVTPERIIDIDQKGVFAREISSTRFERVQDVTTDVSGVFATLLNFGTMTVQSAGDVREFYMRGAREPYKCKDIILDQLRRVSEEPDKVTIASEEDEVNTTKDPAKRPTEGGAA